MKKVLIISYYWPPSGGAGVQRWLKLTKYLAQMGIEVHVVTVDPGVASYMQYDESLCADINDEVHVHTTHSFEPINIYAKLVGKDNVPTAGFSNVDNDNWKQKAANFVRGNCFIPDPRRGWNHYAYRKSVQLIKEHNIKHVITTSPPHSSQLIGLSLKKKFKSSISWIADFRDPWTDIYYYDLLQLSAPAHWLNSKYEKDVIEQSDAIITVGEDFKSVLLDKSKRISADKITVIPNGFDLDDFPIINSERNEGFTISYVGTISDHYQPDVFFQALGQLITANPETRFKFRFVGRVSDNVKRTILIHLKDCAEFIPPVSHEEAVRYMMTSDLLLLVTQGEEGTIPGKTFEYLASRSNIICIGLGDATETIERCKAGRGFSREEESAISSYLDESLSQWENGESRADNTDLIKVFSRKYQAEQLALQCKTL